MMLVFCVYYPIIKSDCAYNGEKTVLLVII